MSGHNGIIALKNLIISILLENPLKRIKPVSQFDNINMWYTNTPIETDI